jgi:hypothetical protein
MSRLLDPRKIVEVKLPSFPDDTIEMYDGLTVSQLRQIDKLETDFDRGLLVIRLLMKSWTFTNEKDQPLEITEANLEKFPNKDFMVLMTRANELLGDSDVKKKAN